MNSRYIPVVAFVIWSIVCWRWYVCGIKEQCDTANASTPALIQPVATPAPSIDTTGQFAAQNIIQPAKNSEKKAGNAAGSAQKALTNDIESAQVVAVADHVMIHFPYGSTRRIDDNAIDAYLSELAEGLINSGGRVSLVGYTDGIGDIAYNKAMSLDRAKHIKVTLVKKGVKSSQISVKGMGESKPLGSNDNPQGRYKNRRVEVRIGH